MKAMGILVGFATAAIVLSLIGIFIIQQIWNAVIPDITGWSEITFWQALLIYALCSVLFGGGFKSRK